MLATLLKLLLLIYTINSVFYDGDFCKENECQCLTTKTNCCNTQLMEDFNSKKVIPLLNELVTQNYFRYYKVNLNRDCQFWPEEKKCALKNCNVDSCTNDELPQAFKNNAEKDNETCSTGSDLPLHNVDTGLSQEEMDIINELGSEDKSVDFIFLKDYLESAQYVDLVKNPERYTGFAGQGSAKIWHSIFQENCPSSQKINGKDGESCIEFKIISRILSGFRTSVAIHLSARYPLETDRFHTKWGINYSQLQRRFSPQATGSNGSLWIKDLFFTYTIVHRSLLKLSGLLKSLNIETGSQHADHHSKEIMLTLIDQLKMAPGTFKESVMFNDTQTSPEIMDTICTKFKNISRILDCVACDKCRLWGKTQVQGLATALKILFTPTNGVIQDKLSPAVKLNRMEIVSLFNVFSRFSNSLDYLNQWRKHMLLDFVAKSDL